jgi:hypothetical protein
MMTAMMTPRSPRHHRLQALRDRFVAANLRSRSLRLLKGTRSGALDLSRIASSAPRALSTLLETLGRRAVSAVIADHGGAGASVDATSVSDDVFALAGAVRLDEQLTGACDLAVGWPIVEGRSADGVWLRGPLLLYPAVLEQTTTGKRQWRLVVEATPLLNAPLAQAIDRATGVRFDIDALLDGDDDRALATDDDTLVGLHTTLARLALPMGAAPTAALPLLPLAPRLVAAREALPLGCFTLTSTLVLGRFPRAGSTIAADYDALLASTLSDDQLGAAADLLAVDEDAAEDAAALADDDDDDDDDAIAANVDDLLGSRRFQVLPSDKSQDAVFAFLDDDHHRALVVQGPPGTGKSQLLANLVVAAAGQGKKVLVVCQKRAALDVVADRLGHCGFSSPLALVHDVEHDRARVAHSIERTLEPIVDVSGPPSAASSSSSSNTSPSAAASPSIAERGHRLRAAQGAWRTLTSASSGRPSLAALQELRLKDGAAHAVERVALVPLDDVVDDAIDAALLLSQQTRLESVWGMAEPLLSPHPVAYRGDWSGPHLAVRLSSISAASAGVAAVAAHNVSDRGDVATVSAADAIAVKDAIDDGEGVLAVMGDDDHAAARGALLLFWGWTEGGRKDGVWTTAVERLRRARRELTPISAALFACTATQLSSWAKELETLASLQPSLTRFFRPRYWRLRKVVVDVFDVASRGDALAPVGPSTFTLQIEAARAAVAMGQAWHQLLVDLPDHDTLALGVDGTHESLELALSSLQVRHSQVEQLHRLHTALRRAGATAALRQPLELGVDGGFVDAALSARQALRLWRHATSLLSTAAPHLDERHARAWQSALAGGDVDDIARALGALVAAAMGSGGAATDVATRAAGLDHELHRDTPSLRAFLKRVVVQPGAPASSATIDDVTRAFRRSVQERWLRDRLQHRDPAVLEAPLIDAHALRRLGEVHAACHRDAATLSLSTIAEALAARAKSTVGGRQLRKLLADVKKKRRQPTLRALTETYWGSGLAEVLPVWLCSPESAAALFPPTAGLFDLVIFDEASQCPVEAAIPALVRARRAIVAGDEQQMPPSHFFQAGARDVDEDDDDSSVLASHSVLELCRVAYPSTTLAWHYRSADERLIAFSNAAFYGGKLCTAPQARRPDRSDVSGDGLHFNLVNGRWRNQHNRVEADAVVDCIRSILVSGRAGALAPSIGVVAFNQKQAEVIDAILDERQGSDADLAAALAADRRRPAVEQLFIRNLENVQGDERDVIIISPAYGPDDDGVLHARFGPLGHVGGEKRLNVAVTRARRGMHVFCSFNPDDLDVSRSAHVGPKLFRTWLRTMRAASDDDDDALDAALAEARILGGGRGVVDAGGAGDATRGVGSVVVDQLETVLTGRGHRVRRSAGLGSHRLDLVVGDSAGMRVGVDVSGFLAEADALARDVSVPAFWARAGWHVLRVTPRAWHDDKDGVVARVEAALG